MKGVWGRKTGADGKGAPQPPPPPTTSKSPSLLPPAGSFIRSPHPRMVPFFTPPHHQSPRDAPRHQSFGLQRTAPANPTGSTSTHPRQLNSTQPPRAPPSSSHPHNRKIPERCITDP
jgi:hypothetical protein